MATRKRKTELVVVERTEICKNCRHGKLGDGQVECHRIPPSPVFDFADQAVITYFPVLAVDNWCSEFAAQLNS